MCLPFARHLRRLGPPDWQRGRVIELRVYGSVDAESAAAPPNLSEQEQHLDRMLSLSEYGFCLVLLNRGRLRRSCRQPSQPT